MERNAQDAMEAHVETNSAGCYIKARHSMALLQFLGMVCVVIMRNNLSVAIVAMVNKTSVESQEQSCSTERSKNTTSPWSSKYGASFSWNMAKQGLLLGCYFYGYITSNLFGACLSNKFGMKRVVGITVFGASVLTLCTPIVAQRNFWLFILLRVTLGLLCGVVNPTMVGSWGIWAPPLERSCLISFFSSGTSVGALLNLLLSGMIAEYLGWRAVFYTTGGASLLWSLLWIILAHNSPQQHPRISEEERRFLSLNSGTELNGNLIQVRKKPQKTPWKSIFTSMPFLAICVAQFASNWGNFSMQVMLPTYISTVLNFNISSSSLLSALPYLVNWILMVMAGYLSDVARRKKLLSVANLRKCNQTISLTMTALFVVLTGYVGCNVTVAIAFLCISIGFNALSTPGCVANTVDIAPAYAGILFGVGNSIGSIPGFLAPQVFGWILLNESSFPQWQNAFWVSASVAIFGTLFFLRFSSGKEQSWAKAKIQKINKNQEA